MKKITAVFLVLLLLSTLFLGDALTAKKAYAYSLKVDNVKSQIDSENVINWDIPIDTVHHSDEEFFTNLYEVYDNDRIVITRPNNEKTIRIEADAQIGDVITYRLVNNNCVVDQGKIVIEDESDITDGKYICEFDSLHIFSGKNVFTVSLTRGDEVIRNGLTFEYFGMAMLSESRVSAPTIERIEIPDYYQIAWQPQDDVDFNVYRSENGIEYFLLATVLATSEQYTYIDETCDSNKTYYYAVKAISSTGISDYSNIICIKNKPLLVEGIKVSSSAGSTLLQWNASNGAEWYEVSAVIDGEEQSFNVIGTYIQLIGSVINTIKIKACNELGVSDSVDAPNSLSTSNDCDNDGLTDAEEIILGTYLNIADSDGDGLSDGFEISIGTNPLKYDFDENGLSDGAEMAPKYFDNEAQLYAISKSLNNNIIQMSFYGNEQIFSHKIIAARNTTEFLNTLSKSVLYPIDIYAQDAEYINLSFDLSNVTPYSTKENLRIYYVNNETKQLELVAGTIYENDCLTGTVYSSGTYIVADQSVQTDYTKETEVVILIEKQYRYTYYKTYCPGHTETYCPGHTETYCPGHPETYCPGHQYACIVHYHCNGGRPDCIYFSDRAYSSSPSVTLNSIPSATIAVAPNLWYCSGCKTRTTYCSGCQTRTTYCSGCQTRTTYCGGCKTTTRVFDTRYDYTFTEIDVATGILNSLNNEIYQIGIAQNTSYGIKAVFSDTYAEKLSILASMKCFYYLNTLGSDLSNAMYMFSSEENNKKIIYIRHNGYLPDLKPEIQQAYALGIETDVISMYNETDGYMAALIQAAHAGNGCYYGVDYSATDSEIETIINEICQNICSVWEAQTWIYNERQIENLQVSYSNMYAGLDSEEVSQWTSTASTNLLTGGYINQSIDIQNYSKNGYLDITRTYNSLNAKACGYFGNGFSSVFDCKVTESNPSTAVVTNEIAPLYMSIDGSIVRYISKGTELSVSSSTENYTLVEFENNEYYILNSDIYQGDIYTVFLPTGGSDKFILENGIYTSIGNNGSLVKDDNTQIYTYTAKDFTIYTFDSNNRISGISNKYGEKTLFSYSENEITVSDLYGNSIIAALSSNKIISLSMNGNSVSYVYENDNLVTVDWYGEKEENYSYHYITGLLDEIKDSAENTVLYFEYDLLGRIKNKYTRNSDDGTIKESFLYDNLSSTVYALKPNGTILKVVYNAFLEPVSESYIDGNGVTHTLWQKTYYVFDSANDQWKDYTACVNGDEDYLQCQALKSQNAPKKETQTKQIWNDGDYVDATTTTEFDSRGNIVKVTDAKGNEESYAYNSMDCIISHTDKLGNIETYTYDTTNVYMISSTDKLNRETTYDYSENLFADSILKQLETVTYPNGDTLELTYDSFGNITSETKTYGDESSCTTSQYYANGKISSVTNPLGGVTTYTYTLCGELSTVTDSFGAKSYSYDADGRLISETSENGIITNYERAINGSIITKTIIENSTVIYQENYTYDSVGNLVIKEIVGGAVYEYAYDYANRLIAEREIRTAADETLVTRVKSCEYDYNGLLTQTTDYLGNVTLYAYDLNGNKIKTVEVIDAENTRVTLYQYDALDRQTSVTYASGATESTQYDALNRVTTQTDKLGNQKTYAYDDVENSVTITDQCGYVTKIYNGLFGVTKESYLIAALDENDQPILVEDRATEYFYDASGNTVGKVLPNGLEYVYTFDTRNRLTQTDEYDQNGVLLATSTASYDNVNNLTQETAKNGLVTAYTYDALNRPVSISQTVASQTRTTSYQYDIEGRITKITDALGAETVYQYTYSTVEYLTVTATYANGAVVKTVYDALDRTVKEIDALNTATVRYYDALGNLTAVCVGDRVTQYFYDIMGNNTRITDARGNETDFTYDAMGRLATKTNADNSTITYTYDNLGNVLTTVDGNNNTTHYQYDRYGNNTQITNALGDITTYEYDDMNNLVTQTNALSEDKIFTYDLYNNLLSVQQGGVTYSYLYDISGNLVTETHPIGSSRTYEYDLFGNVTKYTDESGLYETYAYDLLNRLTTKTDRKGVMATYTYDSVGNLTSETVGSTITEYTYNANNQVTQIEINDIVSQSYEYTVYNEISAIDYGGGYRVEYLYDYCGNKTRVQFLGEQLLYTYDEMNRISTVSNNGVVTTYTYDLNGNTTSVETGDNISSVYTFNALNLPLTQVNTVGQTSETNSYVYDDLCRVTQKNENGVVTTYTYDALGRLATVTEGERLTSYAYDSNSNRTGKTVTENGGTLTETYVYDVCGRLLSLDSNGVVTTYVYDNNGNQISVTTGSDVDTFIYDTKNRLVSTATNGVETAEFSYYANGLRKSKGSELFIYDGKNVLAEVSDTDIRLNVYGNALLFTIQGTINTENEVTFVDGKIAYAYEFNLHGDVVKVLGIAGIVLNTYTYDAFGVITSQSATVANTFFYAGYQYDDETGLYYLRSRYYNAETARFITEDGFKGYYDDPLSLNRYTYCHNSPIIYFDPDGEAAINTRMTDTGYSLDSRAMANEIRQEIDKNKESQDKNFIQKIVEDYENYKSYKTAEGGHYNDDPEKVYEAHYFSDYQGSLVINLPWNIGSMGIGCFIFMGINKNTSEKYNKENPNKSPKNYDNQKNSHLTTLNHEYGHNMISMEYGLTNMFWFNALPSFIGFIQSDNDALPENFTDKTGPLNEIGEIVPDANDPYQNQPWESLANKYGGNNYSVRRDENDYYMEESTNTYVEKYKNLKQKSLLNQLIYMSVKSKTAGIAWQLLISNGTEIWDNFNSLIWGK